LYQLGDVDSDSGDSVETELYDYDVRDSDSDTDAGHSAAAAAVSPQASTLSADLWEHVADGYIPPVDFPYADTPGLALFVNLTADSHLVEFVNLFLTDDVLTLFVTETNRFAEQFISNSRLKPKATAHSWHATDQAEMKKFLGLLLLMGVVKEPRVEDFWSTDPATAMQAFNNTMIRDMFELLLKFWHFCNNDEQLEGDRLFKLRNICDLLISQFQSVYTPEKEVSIDESVVLCHGRLIFRQYFPGKHHKYGVKLYLLCETSGYVWNMLVYCSKMDPMKV